ncbi:hypothetical protein [Lactococcus cremoris]|uniref:hypothetical protein n=1 Tax=Lactococcus lactis subsp. cremoris TaxID=1359 RepID=UPI002182233E|nr:hypothetical protein [Lactococcus cremoris]MCT0506804.1 hypothetical protein [Lactococcus cremoris]
MKNKIKDKSFDLVCTFLGTIPAIYFYRWSSTYITNLFKNLSMSKGIIDIILTAVLSFYVSIGFIVALFLLWCISFLKRPKIYVSFYNEAKTQINYLDFTVEKDEPQFLSIKIETRLRWLQKKIIDLTNPQIQISTNTTMCKIELDEGFIYQNDDYKSIEQKFLCDIYRNFQVSGKNASISVDVSVLLIRKATGEIKVESVFDKENFFTSFIKSIFKYYCIYDVKPLKIRGE